MLIRTYNLTEPAGFEQFTYQHPSIPERKSKIDHFLFSSDIGLEWHRLVKYCAFLDYQALVLYPRHPIDMEPQVWYISNDLLDYMPCFTQLRKVFHEACNAE